MKYVHMHPNAKRETIVSITRSTGEVLLSSGFTVVLDLQSPDIQVGSRLLLVYEDEIMDYSHTVNSQIGSPNGTVSTAETYEGRWVTTCECGSEKVGLKQHSHWCPKHT